METFLGETLKEVADDKPYMMVADDAQIPRSNLKMASVSWLAPLQEGYSRALPLCFLPAITPKVKKAHSLPHLGLAQWASCTYTLAERCQMLILQHPLESI